MQTVAEVVSIVEEAFRPLRCAVKIHDHNKRLSLRVFNTNDKFVLQLKDAILEDLRGEVYLQTIILRLREEAESRGHVLLPQL